MNNNTDKSFLDKFIDDLCILGNHHGCKIFTDTFEERGNKLLEESNHYLKENSDIICLEDKIKIKCYQFWIVGFLAGQNMTVYPDNAVSTNIT